MREKNFDFMSRKSYLDFLRVIAILFVLFIHTDQRGFLFYTVTDKNIIRYLTAMISSFSTAAVPLFFMISGAVLIPKEEKISEIYKRRIPRCLIAIVLGSFINYLCLIGWDFYKIDFIYFLRTIYSDQILLTYWFLYAYLAYLLLLPLLRKIAKVFNKNDYLYILILSIVMNSLPLIEWILWEGEISHNSSFSLFICTNYFLYPLLGHFLDGIEVRNIKIKRERGESKKTFEINALVILALLCVFLSWVSSHFTISKFKINGDEWEQSFFGTYASVYAATIFISTKILFAKIPISGFCKKAFLKFGGCSFGIMLTDHICSVVTYPIYESLVQTLHYWPAAWAHVFFQWLFGVMVISICKLIPGIRKLL